MKTSQGRDGASLQRRGSGVRAARCKQLNEPGQDQAGRWARPKEGCWGKVQGRREPRSPLSSAPGSARSSPGAGAGQASPPPPLTFPPFLFPCGPEKPAQPSRPSPRSLPSPLCQAKCPCAFRPQLRCHLPQEDSPDQSSPAGPTPSECPKHSAMALVTPLPWSLQWFGGSAAPLPPPLFLRLVGGPGTWSVLSSLMLDAGMKAADGEPRQQLRFRPSLRTACAVLSPYHASLAPLS